MKKTITIASIRNKAKYTGPLSLIEDNIYYCLDRYMKEEGKDKYNFNLYGTSFDGNSPKYDLTVLDNCDVFVVISVVEWLWNIKNNFHSFDMKKSDDRILEISKKLDNKKLVLITHEQADTIELFKNKTFHNVNFLSTSEIHQKEMGDEFMNMRYDFIKNYIHTVPTLFGDSTKQYDFMYWGSSKTRTAGNIKTNDERQEILKGIHEKCDQNGLTNYFQGRFQKIKVNSSWDNNFSKLVPKLQEGKTTLCFQWPGKEQYLTTRYPEALACGVIPLMWKNFDINNVYNSIKWQKCETVDDVVVKIKQCKDDTFRLNILKEIEDNFNNRPNKKTVDANYHDFVNVFENKVENGR